MTAESNQEEVEGEWLDFRFREPRSPSSIPIKISRKALEDHFGATGESVSLDQAYPQNKDAFDAKVRELMKPGVVYTTIFPLELWTGDF